MIVQETVNQNRIFSCFLLKNKYWKQTENKMLVVITNDENREWEQKNISSKYWVPLFFPVL